MDEKLKRILLIEDDINDVELTLEELKKFNLDDNVVVIRNGENVIKFLYERKKISSVKNRNPLVILLDIKLQKMNGLEILRKIKGDNNLKKIPVVMVTSSWDEPDLKKSYMFGANAYLVKPVDVYEFMEVTKNLGIYWDLISDHMTVKKGQMA